MGNVVNPPDAPPTKSPRKERAQATRRRILAAASAEFLEKGYLATHMAAIAERAGVSVQMLYLAFGTKPRLLAAIVERAVFDEEGVAPPESHWWSRVEEAGTAAEMLRRLVVESAPVFRAASPMWLVAQVGATVDEDLARSTAEGDRLRARDYRRVIDLAATKGSLRQGLCADTATDLLVAMLSPAFYMELVGGRGWSHDQAIEWLADTLPSLLFDA